MKERLLKIEEVSEITGFSVKTLYNKISSGTMFVPYCRIGRSIRFKESDLENYVKRLKMA